MYSTCILIILYGETHGWKTNLVFKTTLPPTSNLCRVNLAEVYRVLKVFKGPQELLDFRDRKETLVCLVFLDKKDRQDHQDLRVSKVFNILYSDGSKALVNLFMV